MELKVILITIFTALVISFIVGLIIIPLFRKYKIGQLIRDDGPQEHLKKAGTPTLGGIMILVALLATVVIFAPFSLSIKLLVIATFSFALLGFIDDALIIARRDNHGLSAKQKFGGQIAIAIIICIFLGFQGFDQSVSLPGTALSLDLGWFYWPFIIFWIAGFVNAVNLTDGLDGLLAGSAIFSFATYLIISLFYTQYDIAIFAAAMIGALLGFLIFNRNPAKIFMGDTGSLAIGGALVMVSILTKTEILLIVIGGLYVIETLSVILQVFFFKTQKRRIFKMSPIHHHFELSGWSEWKVVLVFWSASLIFALIGLAIGVLL
jgi:phospho-N-acetylmuramoyl-pentapeptide-transferase